MDISETLHPNWPAANAASTCADSTSREDEQTTIFRDLLQNQIPPQKIENGIAIGQISGFSSEGAPLVTIPALALTSIAAKTIAMITQADLGREVAVGFAQGNVEKPIIFGLMLHNSLHSSSSPSAESPDVHLEGENLVFRAESSLEFRCGEAALTLNADGQVHIRGTHITSHATATQRILGGAVSVN